MTERAGRRRASKRELRAWAWIAGGLAFFAPWVALGASPKPATGAAAATSDRPVVIVKRITRRVVIRDRPTPAPVQYVVVGPSSSSGSSSSGSSSSGSAGTVAAASNGSSNGSNGGGSNNAPPPTTTTGGS